MNYIELKQQIIRTLENDVKDADDLLSVCAWALSKSKSLLQEIHNEEDVQNESELNKLENQSSEC